MLVARSRCRLRWFRLAGIPLAERLAALRLQAAAWKPFDHTAARLVLTTQGGLAIAWDADAAHQHLLAQGLTPERCVLLPETLAQPALSEGLRLVAAAEGFEAQHWDDGELLASRWWPAPLTDADWQDFLRGSGASREGTASSKAPEAVRLEAMTTAWAKHYALEPSADSDRLTEHRLLLAGGLALSLTAGALAHQAWDARTDERRLQQQIAELKATAGEVLNARDATLATVQEVEKLANWFAAPQPIDVIAHLNDTLARSGVQIKELELERDKLRLGLQLNPQATRAGIVKDLQSGGWLTEVTEVRADNARNLLTMEMRINGPRPPASVLTAHATAEPAIAPPVQAGGPAAAPAVAAAPASPAPARAAAPLPPQAAAPKPSAGPAAPPTPIFAKPDAQGMPPPDVFDAITTRR